MYETMRKSKHLIKFLYIHQYIYNNKTFILGLGKFNFFFLDKFISIIRWLNPLSANPTNWSNTLKQFVDNFPTNCLSVFDHFVKLALKGLTYLSDIYLALLLFFFETCLERRVCSQVL